MKLQKLQAALLMAVTAVASSALAQNAATGLPLMPLPSHLTRGQGQFIVDGSFNVKLTGYTSPRLERARARFLAEMFRQTGIPLPQEAQYQTAKFIVHTGHAGDAVQQLGEDESYHLQVTPSEVDLTAANPLGILHGLQTFLQLVQKTPQGFAAPTVTIDDSPRFPWRGFMMDVSRHFMPIPVVKRNLDAMEAVKLNVFHWHLSDDQGFRAQSLRYPKLTGDGSDGLYYTQQQMRDVVAYARDRGIRVVPEFDMPCHTTSWFVGYPELASGKGPYHIIRHWGVFNGAMNPTQPQVYTFIDNFVGEMTAIFPDQYFHIGGDECNDKEWNANPQIQQFMREHHLANDAALQAYFTAKVQKLVAAHHRIMEGWDEVLQPNTPKDVVIQSWRGLASLAQAAKQGNRGLLSTPYYLNLNHSAADYFLADPMGAEAANLTPAEQARILGGEACMWSEYVSPQNIDSRTWPSLAAIAERFWSPADDRDVNSMYRRLAVTDTNLAYHNIDTRAEVNWMLRRMGSSQALPALRTLASAVQPPRDYHRSGLSKSDAFTPLNRMVDAAPPDSVAAHHFAMEVQQIVAGNATPQIWQDARMQLVRWRDNDARLQPMLPASGLTADLAPVSADLAQTATIGLAALDALKNHAPISAATREQDMSTLQAAAKPQAVLIDVVAPSVETLLEATPGH